MIKKCLIILLLLIGLPGIIGTILVAQIKSLGDDRLAEGILWILFFNSLFYGWLIWLLL